MLKKKRDKAVGWAAAVDWAVDEGGQARGVLDQAIGLLGGDGMALLGGPGTPMQWM